MKTLLVILAFALYTSNCQEPTDEYCKILDDQVKVFEDKITRIPFSVYQLVNLDPVFPPFSSEDYWRSYYIINLLGKTTDPSNTCIYIKKEPAFPLSGETFKTFHTIVSYKIDGVYDIYYTYSNPRISSKKLTQITGFFSLSINSKGQKTFSSQFNFNLENGVTCKESGVVWTDTCTYWPSLTFTDLIHSNAFEKFVKPQITQQLNGIFVPEEQDEHRLFLE
jgi:hypothetical protein